MTAQQRIVRVRRNYNRWVADETLEDYALRFTAKKARRWSSARVANTAIGAISFLALEAIGGSITINYGFTNATVAIIAASVLIFLTSLPIAYYACRDGVDIDLLTRGAGFGYIGSTITSLIYASFTFIFFAIEAAIMSLALELCFGVPLAVGYVVSSLVVIPLVTHGITLISRFQLWTQPVWVVLHLLPFAFIAAADAGAFEGWKHYQGAAGSAGFNLVLFGTAATVVFSLVAQIGEQVDFLRFLPPRDEHRSFTWWLALVSAGPGWIIPGALKMLAGSFLAYLAISHLVPPDRAAEPTQMYLVAFGYVFASPKMALIFAGAFIIISQLKINVTNAYAGSIAWSNFFSRLTHSHPGRVVWVVFNVAIALLLMELGIFKMLEHTLGLYSIVAVAWVGALVADLVINKPLGLSPPTIEFKRAHLYDINPVGVGAMLLAATSGVAAYAGAFGEVAEALSTFVALSVAFCAAPAIAIATRGRYYIARVPKVVPGAPAIIPCAICELPFEAEDIAHCPAYSGPICSLCCSLETRCRDCCKPHGRFSHQAHEWFGSRLPDWVLTRLSSDVSRYLGVLAIFAGAIGLVLAFVYFQISYDSQVNKNVLQSTLWSVFFILTIIAGIAAWLFVLAHDSRQVAEEETNRQTELLMHEIDAHKRTDAKLQQAKEVAEAASNAKTRHLAGLSHELRSPLNAIFGYAQVLERDPAIPAHRVDAVRVMRRNAEHLSGLIDGLLDISKIEAGRFRLEQNYVRLPEFLHHLVDMFRLQTAAKNIDLNFVSERLPPIVQTDESRLRQILINLLSNAVKFTDKGGVTLRVRYRSQVAQFQIEDSGIGIESDDLESIFQPFERARSMQSRSMGGTGLGLTIAKLLTETMGGEIKVRSTVGQGSTFTAKLFLPEVTSPRASLAIDDRISGYVGPRHKIIICDDDALHRDLAAELLRGIGFTVIAASSGTECLTLVEQHLPSLVLLDIGMPEMNGWEVARRLRQAAYDGLAIVLVSALAPDKVIASEPDRLHDGYLMKPLNFQQLLEQIHILLEIEWIYDNASPSEQVMPVGALTQLHAPPLADLEELQELAEIGHVRGIQRKLDEIAQREPRCAPIVSQLRTLIGTFDLRGFNAAVRAIHSDYV